MIDVDVKVLFVGQRQWVEKERFDTLEKAANEVLRVYMSQFNDSRSVDDCLVGLAAAVAGVDTLCPHGMVLAENTCGPCSEGRLNPPQAQAHGENCICAGCLNHGLSSQAQRD